VFTACRVVAWILYELHIFENGDWGSDYMAIWLYRFINPKRAVELADEMFPVMKKYGDLWWPESEKPPTL
jgi:hypothetical protein